MTSKLSVQRKKYIRRNKHGKKDAEGVLIVDFFINISRFVFPVTLQETFCKLFGL